MVNLHNYGGADAVLADSSFVVSNAAPNTGLTCTGGNNLPITGTITAGQNNSADHSVVPLRPSERKDDHGHAGRQVLHEGGW